MNVVSQKDENNIEKDLSEKQKMILDNLYRCRDLEINNLWQKGVFLGPFLVLCFTGYGFLLHELLGEKTFSSKMNFLCIALCVVSATFSILWIYMFKGSKAQYELCERAISNYEQRELKIPYGYAMGTLRHNEIEFDDNLLNTKPGKFSPSKVNIVIGQVSLWIWIICFLSHFILLFLEILKKYLCEEDIFIDYIVVRLFLLFTIFLIISYVLVYIEKSIRSSYLSPSKEEIYKNEVLRIITKKGAKKMEEEKNKEYLEENIINNQKSLKYLQKNYKIKEEILLFKEKEEIYLDTYKYLVELGEIDILEKKTIENNLEGGDEKLTLQEEAETNLSSLASALGIGKERIEKLNNYIQRKISEIVYQISEYNNLFGTDLSANMKGVRGRSSWS